MAKVFSNFDTRQLSRRLNQMLADFTYKDEVLGTIQVDKSFTTNYASIDVLHNVLLFVFYALVAGYGDKAATIHDWLYSGFGIKQADGTVYYPSREECDKILFRALRAEGVALWRTYLFYCGVRIGGRKNYTSMAVFAPIPIEDALVA